MFRFRLNVLFVCCDKFLFVVIFLYFSKYFVGIVDYEGFVG